MFTASILTTNNAAMASVVSKNKTLLKKRTLPNVIKAYGGKTLTSLKGTVLTDHNKGLYLAKEKTHIKLYF